MSQDLDDIKGALRRALPPIRDDGPPLRRDLWPEIARRVHRRPWRITWVDWVAAAAAILAAASAPAMVPALLYLL